MKSLSRFVAVAAVAAMFAGLTGCAATSVAVAKRNLDVQTKMSATVFLEPVSAKQRTVLVQIRNTSDQPGFTIEREVASALQAKGYQVVSEPDQAHYILQANILQVGKSDRSAAESMMGRGYGGAFDGAALGMAASYATGGNRGNMLGAGLLGALAGTVINAAVKDVYFSAITDVQIKERLARGKKAYVDSRHDLKQGTSGGKTVSYSDSTDFEAYQTRVLSSANKVNLEFAEAEPALKQGLIQSISGVF